MLAGNWVKASICVLEFWHLAIAARAQDLIEMDDTSEGRRSPSLLGTRRLDQSTSSSSSFRPTATSASATSRSRETGLGSGSGSSAYGERVKDE